MRVPQGRVTISKVESGVWTPVLTVPNATNVGWGHIAAQCIGRGNRDYRLRGMYIEYENTGSAVSAPTADAYTGLAYYAALGGNKDYLRVPLAGLPAITIAAGYEAYFDDPDGNTLLLHAQSVGSVGVHGRAFTAGSNSRVYGMALVATPDVNDRTKDVIFARTYFSGSNQIPKATTGEIGLTWEIPFGV